MTDEQRAAWEDKKRTWAQQVRQINIPIDPNSGTIKRLISEIDDLYTDVRMEYASLRADKEAIEKRIYVIEKKGAAHGTNNETRKANGVTAVEEFTTQEGTIVNLWALYDEIVEQHEFVSSIIDILNAKHSRLITESGMLKLEGNIL